MFLAPIGRAINTRLVLLVLALVAGAQAQITWTKLPASLTDPPYFNQWHWLRYNDLNGVTMLWVVDNSGGKSSIYSDSLWTFNASTKTIFKIGTNNQTAGGDCVQSTATWPSSRHPVGQMFWDSKRHRLLSIEGVCGAVNQLDMWYFQANNPLTTKTWTRMSPAHVPDPAHNLSSVVHDPDDDVYYLFGTDISGTPALDWVYCPTDLNPTHGTLTANQTAVGCTVPDDWTQLSVVGGRAQHPPGIWMPGLIYDSVHKVIIAFGGSNGDASVQEPFTWTFNMRTKTWTNLNPAGIPTVPGVIQQPFSNWSSAPNIAFNSNDGKIYYHQPTTPPVDWTYDYGTNTWKQLCQCGGSPTGSAMEYDPTINGFVQWAYGGPGVAELWIGQLSGTGAAPTITSVSPLAAGTQGVAYSYTFLATGLLPMTWSVASGSPPPGLSLSSTGVLSGTPSQSGTFTFGVRVTNTTGAAGPTTFSLTIAPNTGLLPTITSSSPLTSGTQNIPYNIPLSATGTAPITWSLWSGTLPPGLTLAASGALSGTPSSAGTYSFMLQASNSAGATTQSMSLTIAASTGGDGPISVPLTIQEALYPGSVTGVPRTGEPFCLGVPVADSASIKTSNLTLIGATAGQFRIVGRWPSNNAKWLEACGIAPSLAAGGTAGLTLTNGAGNFGGSDLATDPGGASPITVNTGAATFTIKKAHFNGIDTAVIGSTTVVASGASQGFVVIGPSPTAAYPANVTCSPTASGGPCTTVYSTANDAASTCAIEQNGPALAVLKCSADHNDGAGHVYMHTTARLYFYRGKSNVKVTASLRNADLGASGTFASAFKGHQGYELRLTPNLSGTLNYKIANHTSSATTGTMSGADSVYLYQGQSNDMLPTGGAGQCGYGCVAMTADTGYKIVKNGSTLLTGTNTQYPQGWADISNGSGAGVEIGVYQLSAVFPKSLEFNSGGTDVRIGIWARQNSQPYYAPWPQYQTHDLFLNFHAAAPASPGDEFLRFQHYLVGRACAADSNKKCHDLSYYNGTKVFPYPLIDPDTEDTTYKNTATGANPATISQGAACCLADLTPEMYRFWYWGSTGGPNQGEFRWSYLMNFITRGFTGRYLLATHWYRYAGDAAWPKSDNFTWRSQSSGVLDNYGFPEAASANSTLASRWWISQDSGEHAHWYGMPDYYMMTGDEAIRDALLDGPKEWFLSTNTYQTGTLGLGMWNTRAVGANLMGAARFSTFLSSIGDPDAAGVLNLGISNYNAQVKPPLCASGYPQGCTMGPVDQASSNSPNWVTQGVNPVRGVPATAQAATGTPWCNASHNLRVNKTFMNGILVQGILELHNAAGPTWADYLNSQDLAYGIAQNALTELYADDGSGRWDVNGFRYDSPPDWANNCTGSGESQNPTDFQPSAQQTVWMHFYAKNLTDGGTEWATKFKINLQKNMVAAGYSSFSPTADFGSVQTNAVLNILNTPQVALNTVSITGFTDNGGGSYTLQWTVPSGTSSYRIKYGPKRIVDWVGFDPGKNIFTGDPVNTMPWFAATNASNVPAPTSAGATQSLTISTGITGLKSSNFSVKAYTSSASVLTCDVNGDGGLNVQDVQAAISQALGTAPCGTADLIGNHLCSVVDVQRIINAALGLTCQLGP